MRYSTPATWNPAPKGAGFSVSMSGMKRTPLPLILIATLLGGCSTAGAPATPSHDRTTFRFEGRVIARDDSCHFDGVCWLQIGDTRVVTMSGRRLGPAPVWGQVEGDPQIGAHAAVYCRREGDGCTLEGSEAYFVRALH